MAIAVAATMFTIRVTDLWQGIESSRVSTLVIPAAQAQSPPSTVAKSSTKPPAAAAVVDNAPAAVPPNADNDPMLMSSSQIELLQKLGQRRAELETWSSEISLREQLLKAAEMRFEGRLAELKAIEDKIKLSLKQYDDEQEAKLKSLVKIYETMKPKDAARIFEQLDMTVLLDVIERMKEAKIAPVIAGMESEKAKKLTTEMAKRRRMAGEETQRTAAQVSKTN